MLSNCWVKNSAIHHLLTYLKLYEFSTIIIHFSVDVALFFNFVLVDKLGENFPFWSLIVGKLVSVNFDILYLQIRGVFRQLFFLFPHENIWCGFSLEVLWPLISYEYHKINVFVEK